MRTEGKLMLDKKIARKIFWFPSFSGKIVCNKNFADIVRDLDSVIIKEKSPFAFRGKEGTRYFRGVFLNYCFTIYPLHREDLTKYSDHPSDTVNGRGNMFRPTFNGRFQVTPGKKVVLYLSMSCSPAQPFILFISLFVFLLGILGLNFIAVATAVFFAVLTQYESYTTSKMAFKHILEIVDGEIVETK